MEVLRQPIGTDARPWDVATTGVTVVPVDQQPPRFAAAKVIPKQLRPTLARTVIAVVGDPGQMPDVLARAGLHNAVQDQGSGRALCSGMPCFECT